MNSITDADLLYALSAYLAWTLLCIVVSRNFYLGESGYYLGVGVPLSVLGVGGYHYFNHVGALIVFGLPGALCVVIGLIAFIFRMRNNELFIEK